MEKKIDNMLKWQEDMRNLLEQIPAPMILLGDFNAYNPLCWSNKMSARGRMLDKSLTDTISYASMKKKKLTTEHMMAANNNRPNTC